MAKVQPGSHSEPWLSLLIPVYNVSAYIESCLASILGQTGKDVGVEIVLLDDVGTDDSWSKVERIARQYPLRLRLLRHPHNRGISAARNTLLENARGRHVWFFDSDDVLLPGAVAGLRNLIIEHSPDLVLCDFTAFHEHPRLKHRLHGRLHHHTHVGPPWRLSQDRDALLTGLLEARQMHAWSKIARREVWRSAPFPDGRYFEDIAVIPALVAAARSWLYAPVPWVGYRQHDTSIIATMTPRKTRDLLASVRDLHAGVLGLHGGIGASARRGMRYFNLRTFANLARNRAYQDHALKNDYEQALVDVFPDGTRVVLADCRRRGWWLRAWRAQHSLARAHWLT